MGLQESQLIPILKEAKVPHQALKKNSKNKKNRQETIGDNL